MIIWLNKLPLAFFLREEYLEILRCLIICDVQQWLVPLGHKCVVDALKCVDDCFVRDIWDGLCKYIIGVIIVHNEVVLIYILGSG